MTEPKFQHDCQNCQYLGTFYDLDVYLCNRPGDVSDGSIIARFGDYCGDYYSSPLRLFYQQLDDAELKIGLGVGGPSMPFRDFLFSEHTCTYYKAWLVALSLLALRPMAKDDPDDAPHDESQD
jgi:hypothetical protein